MLINEVIQVKEGYAEEILVAVQDLLTRVMAKEIKKISTDKFRKLLAKNGHVISIDELIQAVDQSGFASSVNKDEIIPASELPADIDTDAEPTVDVGDLAGSQAMSDIKADL